MGGAIRDVRTTLDVSTTLSELIRSGGEQIGFVISPNLEQLEIFAEGIDEEQQSIVYPLWTHHFELNITLLRPR